MSPLRTVLLLALTCIATAAHADPRWWWDDLRLTDTPTESITPHLVSPPYASGGAGGSAVFVVWSEIDPVGGDLEVWMVATFDGGCSFCAPTRLTTNAVDDTNPRVAVIALPTGFWSFAVAFESGGQVVIAWDSTTVSFRLPPDQLCAQFESVGPAIIANDRYVRFGSPGAVADEPDIAAIATPAFGHFHAAWHERSAFGDDVWYAHDLTARGGPGWRLDAPKVLPPRNAGLSGSVEPAIAADLTTDPDPITGLNTGNRSAVDVVWVELLSTDENQVVGLRSVDSGATFSPMGLRADAPAGPVSDRAGAGRATVARPSIDSASSTFTTTDPSWVMTAWDDVRAGRAGPEVYCDARYDQAPVTQSPDWQVGDELATATSSATEGDTSVALVYSFTNPAPAWLAWRDSRFGPTEILYRTGVLDHLAPDAIDLSRFPYAPVRALDPAASADFQLSHCVFDETTFGCRPTRTAGAAVDVEIDASEMATYAVFADTRFGQSEIFFKRTDRFVFNAAPVLSTGCGPLGDAWIDVEITQVASCPQQGGERMGRYLVYHGTNSGGPFDNAGIPIVVPHDLAAGPTITRRITGLLPGTTYQVVVIPEDQARNVYPQDFEPTRDAPVALPNEASIATPGTCVAAPICLWRSDVRSLLPYVPDRSVVYLVPPTADDVSLSGPSYQCPFADGDLEQDANAIFNGVPLVLYQVNRPVGTLMLARTGTTIRFNF